MASSEKKPSISQLTIVEYLVKHEGYSHAAAWRLVRIIFGMIREGLKAGKTVKIPKLGSFEMRTVKRRKRAHPKNGKIVELPAHVRPFFRPSKQLIQRVEESE